MSLLEIEVVPCH